MDVAAGWHWEAFVEAQMQAVRDGSSSQVVPAGLRLAAERRAPAP